MVDFWMANSQRFARLAWPVSVAGFIFTLLILINGYRLDNYSFEGQINVWYMPIINILPVLVAFPVGAVIATRLPEVAYGWIWIMMGFGAGVIQPAGGLLAYTLLNSPAPALLAGGLAAHLAMVGWLITMPMIPLALIYFPTGRMPSVRWKWLVNLLLFATLITGLVGWMIPGDHGFAPVINPIGVQGPLGQAAEVISIFSIIIVLFFGFSAAALSLIMRYRYSSGLQRAQIRWLVYAAVLNAVQLLFDSSELHQPWISETTMTALGQFFLLSLPVAVLIAVLRFRLYDIDFVIRKTLLYTLLTGFLVSIYFGGVVVLQAVFNRFTGEANSPLVTVISTLAIAALFNPLHIRTQTWLDRRFYREKYNAELQLSRFSFVARDEVDLGKLVDSMVSVVESTIKPNHLALWLVDDTKKNNSKTKVT